MSSVCVVNGSVREHLSHRTKESKAPVVEKTMSNTSTKHYRTSGKTAITRHHVARSAMSADLRSIFQGHVRGIEAPDGREEAEKAS